ncbi:hypothetical protein TSUD_360040 [Trifolium subterraneum]|uniref:Uncharacterized protein n=1 Tax=Trifolium subterraneum TaxID=3900 RepID=A0A2Z6MUY9_TRISU|nr:hypothetical protein TSUD_360040 [Trifolium subterraneum]
MSNESLQLPSKEQKIADVNVFKLVEQQKVFPVLTLLREKEEALNKILQLEKQLEAKQKLEMEMEELRGQLEVGDEDNAAVKKKMEELIARYRKLIKN